MSCRAEAFPRVADVSIALTKDRFYHLVVGFAFQLLIHYHDLNISGNKRNVFQEKQLQFKSSIKNRKQ